MQIRDKSRNWPNLLGGTDRKVYLVRVKRNLRAASFALLVIVLVAPTARAGDHDLQKQLNWEYADKVLTLRRFYAGDHLKFLFDGRLVGDAPIGPWTLDGRVEVKQIHVRNGLLEIKARRIHIVFDSKAPAHHASTPIDQMSVLNGLSGKIRDDIEKSLRKMEVSIEIELPSGKPNEKDIDSAIHAVFLMPGESMIEAVPPYWRRYFAEFEGRPSSAPIPGGQVNVIGRGMSPPHAISAPDPDYSDEARKTKYQGTMVAWLVVDPTGKPRDLQIQIPLGLGLDEKAIEAISAWKFEPALKDGDPVAVQINVEVSFRLY